MDHPFVQDRPAM
uniref:Uncharacterized protein n=1 Tax=Arundo donax TaxID=35708 RepID=A0A0A9AJJ7_ARUDO